MWILGRDNQHYLYLLEFYGVLLYTLSLCFLEVMPSNPVVLYIPNGVELGLDENFKILPYSYWRISL